MASLSANDFRRSLVGVTALTGADQLLFAAAPYGSTQERFVANVSASNNITINLMGGAAIPNTADTVTLAVGERLQLSATNAWTVRGTAGDFICALER